MCQSKLDILAITRLTWEHWMVGFYRTHLLVTLSGRRSYCVGVLYMKYYTEKMLILLCEEEEEGR